MQIKATHLASRSRH